MSFLIDIFVALLLISAIGYGIVLNRKIVALRRDQAGLEKLANSFHNATQRAEDSVKNLKETAKESAAVLNDGVNESAKIRDDLNFLIERGEKLADHLESAVRHAENSIPNQPDSGSNKGLLQQNELTENTSQNQLPSKPQKKPTGSIGAVSPELVANKIVESEVERKFLRALRAVR